MYKKYKFPIIFLLVLSVCLFFINIFGLVGPLGFLIWLIVPFLLILATVLSLLNLIKTPKEDPVNKNSATILMVLSSGLLVSFLCLLFFTS